MIDTLAGRAFVNCRRAVSQAIAVGLVATLPIASASATRPDLDGLGSVLDVWVSGSPDAMMSITNRYVDGWREQERQVVRGSLNSLYVPPNGPVARLGYVQSESGTPELIVADINEGYHDRERDLAGLEVWIRELARQQSGVYVREDHRIWAVLPRVVIALGTRAEFFVAVAPRRGVDLLKVFGVDIAALTEALSRVPNKWIEPAIGSQELARLERELAEVTNTHEETLTSIDGRTLTIVRNPPGRFAALAIEVAGSAPGVYGAPVSELLSTWHGAPVGILDALMMRDLAPFLGSTGCPPLSKVLQAEQGSQAAYLLRSCRTARIAPRNIQALGRWQVLTALVLDYEAVRRGLGESGLHRRVLAALLEPATGSDQR